MEKQIQYYLQRSEEMLQAAEHWLASDLSASWREEIARSYLEQARKYTAAVRSAEEEEEK